MKAIWRLTILQVLYAGSAFGQTESDDATSIALRKLYATATHLFAEYKGAPDKMMKGWYVATLLVPGTEQAKIHVFDSTHAYYGTYIARNANKDEVLEKMDQWKDKISVALPQLHATKQLGGNKYFFEQLPAGDGPPPAIVLSTGIQARDDERWNAILYINFGIK